MELTSSTATIIVTCKGRLEHLKQTLPAMQNQWTSYDYEILVVDYGDPDQCAEWARPQSKTITMKVLDGTEFFSLSRARNCGAVFAKSDMLCFVDADSQLDSKWLQIVCLELDKCGTGIVVLERFKKQCNGICAVRRDLFMEVRGYDEQICSWGKEEEDFYGRCKAAGGSSTFSANLVSAISHSNDRRVEYYEDKGINRFGIPNSNDKNDAYLKKRRGQVNPTGFGWCVFVG